jgi:hypothetical protein
MASYSRLEFVMGISVVSLTIGIGVSNIYNIMIAAYFGFAADAIQILSWVYWLWKERRETAFETVPEKIDTILTYVSEKETVSKTKEKLISRLVNEGAIEDNELYNLAQAGKKEIILAFPYGESVARGVISVSGSNKQPLANLLEELGFIKATRFQNVMVAFADSLPPQLRRIGNLQMFLRTTLKKRWHDLSGKVKKEYPEERYKVRYAKWRSVAAYGATYILMKSVPRDFLVQNINRTTSFTPEFKKHIWRVIDRSKLKAAFEKNRRKVREVISKISIDFFLKGYPEKVRDPIVQSEKELKETFQVKVFTDYRKLDQNELTEVLENFLPQTERNLAPSISSSIKKESEKCFEILEDMGISLN